MPKYLTIRLRLPCPPDAGVTSWGDYHFAMSLTKALTKLGHRVLVDFATSRGNGKPVTAWVWRRRWMSFRSTVLQRADVDLILRGNLRYDAVPGRPCLMWMISNSRMVAADELSQMAHVFVASSSHAAALSATGQQNLSVLLQCTDPDDFSPTRAREDLRTEALFVGNKRKFDRVSVSYAVQAGLNLRVWGRGWEGLVPPGQIAGQHVSNAEVGAHYSSAGYVLNDHAPDMMMDGFASNRVFDVLACGVPLVSDAVPDLPPSLANAVYRFESYPSFLAACALAGAETAERKADRRAIAETVRRDHSFDARARVIEAVARQVLQDRAAG